jgi:hypothetical protein
MHINNLRGGGTPMIKWIIIGILSLILLAIIDYTRKTFGWPDWLIFLPILILSISLGYMIWDSISKLF